MYHTPFPSFHMDNTRDTQEVQPPEEHPLKKAKKPFPRPSHLDTDEKLHGFIEAVHETWSRKLREGYVIPEHLNTDEKCLAYLIQNHRNYIEKVNRVCHTNWWQSIVNSYDPVPVERPMTTSNCNESLKSPKRVFNERSEVMPYVDMVMNNSSSEKSDEVFEQHDNQQTGFVSIGMLEEEKSLHDSTEGDEQGEEADATNVMSDNLGSEEWNEMYKNSELKNTEMISEQQNSFLEHLLGQEGCSYALDHCGGCVQCDKIWVQPVTQLGLPLNMTDWRTWHCFFGSASRPVEIMHTLRKAGNRERFKTDEEFETINELCYWENMMVQSFLTFIVHELHPTNVYVHYVEEDTTLWDEGHPVKPSELCTELRDLVQEYTFLIVVMLMQGQSKHFCMYIFDLQNGTVRVCDPDEDAKVEDHTNVSFELILLWANQTQYMVPDNALHSPTIAYHYS